MSAVVSFTVIVYSTKWCVTFRWDRRTLKIEPIFMPAQIKSVRSRCILAIHGRESQKSHSNLRCNSETALIQYFTHFSANPRHHHQACFRSAVNYFGVKWHVVSCCLVVNLKCTGSIIAERKGIRYFMRLVNVRGLDSTSGQSPYCLVFVDSMCRDATTVSLL